MFAHTTSGEWPINLFKPIQPYLNLNRIDSGVWHRQTSVGNMLIANARSECAAVIVEELKAQSRVGHKVYVRRIQRHRMVTEKQATTEFKIRDAAGRAGK